MTILRAVPGRSQPARPPSVVALVLVDWAAMMSLHRLLLLMPAICAVTASAFGWDAPGHMIVTDLAIDALPGDFPAWVKREERRARLRYLSVEPDRWRGQDAPVLNHINGPDHYFDVEDLADFGLTLRNLPRFRNQFIEHLEARRVRNPERFATTQPEKDRDYTRSVPGLLPWAVEELRWKVASSWTTLRTLEKNSDVATPVELDAARDNIIQHMGLLSHFIGDAAQPLHMTRHHHGWVGENPKRYTTDRKFHQYIDGTIIAHHRLTYESLRARRLPPNVFDPQDDWAQIAEMLDRSFQKVERLYALEKSGDLRGPAGKAFVSECLLEAGANLAGIWIAAYEASRIDDFLDRRLGERRPTDTASSTQPTTQAGVSEPID